MKQTEQPKFDLSLYNDEFFQWHLTHVHESSVRCMEWYCDNYKPESVLDIGCGIGSYLLGALNKGAKVHGIEISEDAKKFTDKNIVPYIQYKSAMDISHVWQYSCVICLEVAEHIEPKDSEQLIQNITSVSKKRILFSAAPEGQQGCGHINLRPKEYWLELFTKYGRNKVCSMTSEHIAENWQKLGAPDYIVNNLIVL